MARGNGEDVQSSGQDQGEIWKLVKWDQDGKVWQVWGVPTNLGLQSKEGSGPGNLPKTEALTASPCGYNCRESQGIGLPASGKRTWPLPTGSEKGVCQENQCSDLTPLLTSDLPLVQLGTREQESQPLYIHSRQQGERNSTSIKDAVIVSDLWRDRIYNKMHSHLWRVGGNSQVDRQKGRYFIYFKKSNMIRGTTASEICSISQQEGNPGKSWFCSPESKL